MENIMSELIATTALRYENMPVSYFGQDGKAYDDLCFRAFMGHQGVNSPSKGEDLLQGIGSWAKVATAGLRIPIFADSKGWAKTNPGHVISKEPNSRKLNPVIADFMKAHGRLPASGDTMSVTSHSEIFVPTTFSPGGNPDYTGKYGASLNDVLTKKQWEEIPDSQKSRQNCVYEILNTTDISFTAGTEESTAQAVAPNRREGW
jgi:hypothetical protein